MRIAYNVAVAATAKRDRDELHPVARIGGHNAGRRIKHSSRLHPRPQVAGLNDFQGKFKLAKSP